MADLDDSRMAGLEDSRTAGLEGIGRVGLEDMGMAGLEDIGKAGLEDMGKPFDCNQMGMSPVDHVGLEVLQGNGRRDNHLVHPYDLEDLVRHDSLDRLLLLSILLLDLKVHLVRLSYQEDQEYLVHQNQEDLDRLGSRGLHWDPRDQVRLVLLYGLCYRLCRPSYQEDLVLHDYLGRLDRRGRLSYQEHQVLQDDHVRLDSICLARRVRL